MCAKNIIILPQQMTEQLSFDVDVKILTEHGWTEHRRNFYFISLGCHTSTGSYPGLERQFLNSFSNLMQKTSQSGTQDGTSTLLV